VNFGRGLVGDVSTFGVTEGCGRSAFVGLDPRERSRFHDGNYAIDAEPDDHAEGAPGSDPGRSSEQFFPPPQSSSDL
jgi:hypothetical protein